jgi:hypothetical protein
LAAAPLFTALSFRPAFPDLGVKSVTKRGSQYCSNRLGVIKLRTTHPMLGNGAQLDASQRNFRIAHQPTRAPDDGSKMADKR